MFSVAQWKRVEVVKQGADVGGREWSKMGRCGWHVVVDWFGTIFRSADNVV